MAVLGIIAVLISGTVYGYAISYIPFIYLNFFITIIYGVFVGFIVGWTGKLGKVRSDGFCGFVGLVLGLFAVYVAWVSWLYASRPDPKELALSLGVLWTWISAIAESGAWSLSGWTPKGFALYTIWFLEAAIIAGGAALMAMAYNSGTPFCEDCQRWVEDKTSIFPLTAVENTHELKVQLELQNYSPLKALRRLSEVGSQFTQLDLLHCPHCHNLYLISVANITIGVDSDGNEERNEDFFIQNLFIAKEDYEELVAEVGKTDKQEAEVSSESKPVVADTKPAVFEIEPGSYYWCRCGRSKNQPFCDGSHAGTEFSPQQFEVTEKKRVALCNCKHTGNGPYCDGTHSSL